MTDQSIEFVAGDYVQDRVKVFYPDRDPGVMVVVAVHPDERVDEYVINDDAETIADVTSEWPVNMPDSYDSDGDAVVEVAFYEALDRVFGGSWLSFGAKNLLEACKKNGITTYAYHAERLEDTTPMSFPPK